MLPCYPYHSEHLEALVGPRVAKASNSRLDCGTANDTRLEISKLLRDGSTFVVADVGHPLRWIPEQDRLTFWQEAEDQLVPAEDDGFNLDAYPKGYCYVGSVWHCVGSGQSLCWRGTTEAPPKRSKRLARLAWLVPAERALQRLGT